MEKTVLPKQISHHSIIHSKSQMLPIEQEYIDSLNEKELKAYEIAKSHLGSTFHLIKSNGFNDWKKSKL
jgi:hypothetical protein